MDYACYITIDNTHGEYELTLSTSDALWGTWALPPPPIIARGESVDIILKDTLGPTGSEGKIEYTYQQPGVAPLYKVFTFKCPTLGMNSASGADTTRPIPFYAKSGDDVAKDGHWGRVNEVPGLGHPLAVRYVLGS